MKCNSKIQASRLFTTRVRTGIKQNVIMFRTVIFRNNIPIYYRVIQDGTKYSWEPEEKNRNKDLPSFTIWKSGEEWRVEAKNASILDKAILLQAAEDL